MNTFIDINNEFETVSMCMPKYDPSLTISEPHINLKSKVSKTNEGILPIRNINTNLETTPNKIKDNNKGHGDISHKCCVCSRNLNDPIFEIKKDFTTS